jgi:hypothetical protein
MTATLEQIAKTSAAIDWTLMRANGYTGDDNIEATQPVHRGPFGMDGNPLFFPGMDQTPAGRPFMVWAVTAGRPVFEHVFDTCRKTGYPLELDALYDYPTSMGSYSGAFLAKEMSLLHILLDHLLPGEPEAMEEVPDYGGRKLEVHPAEDWARSMETLSFLLEQGASTKGLLTLCLAAKRSVKTWALLEQHGLDWSAHAGEHAAFQDAFSNNAPRPWGIIRDPAKQKSQQKKDEATALSRLTHLVDKGMPLNSQMGSYRKTFFQHAMNLTMGVVPLSLLKTLLAMGADPHTTSAPMLFHGIPVIGGEPSGRNSWHFLFEHAFRLGERESARLMLRKYVFLKNLGVDINHQDEAGQTVFHLLAGVSDAAPILAEGLLRHGADPTILDHEGKSPLDLAIASGAKGVANVLRTHLAIEQKGELEQTLPVPEGRPLVIPGRL